MLDKMSVMKENGRAILKGFSESDIAVSRREQEARIRNGSVFSLAKVSLLKFRRIEPANRAAPNRAFFIAVQQRYSTLSAATLHAECRQAIPLQAGILSMPESARKTKQVNPFMTLANSNRKLHLISERGFQIAHAITGKHMVGHMDA